MASALTPTALASSIRCNPYAAFLGQTLADRCRQIQVEEAHGHWASMRAELELARATLVDCVQFYAAMHLLPADHKDKLASVLEAGKILRDAIRDVGSLARQAAQIETELRDRHDPQVTLQFIQQTVHIIDEKLREAERLGELRDAEAIIKDLAVTVEQGVRLPAGMGSAGVKINEGPASLTPSQMVQAMIDTVPLAG